MDITARKEGPCTIVELIGMLTDESPLADRVGQMLDEGNPSIVVDLSRVTMITSAGLSVLVQLTARANTQGARFVLASPSPFVEGVLETTKLNRFFSVHAELSEALRAVQA